MTAPSTLPTDREIEEAIKRVTWQADYAERYSTPATVLFSDLRILLSRLSSVEGELAAARERDELLVEQIEAEQDRRRGTTDRAQAAESLLSLALGALTEIKKLKAEPIGDSGFSTGPALHMRRAKEIASQVIAQIKGGQG